MSNRLEDSKGQLALLPFNFLQLGLGNELMIWLIEGCDEVRSENSSQEILTIL